MRCSLALGLASIALTSAQSVSDLPSCSFQCFTAAVASTGCGDLDYLCQCTPSNKEAITNSVTPCLQNSACSITDLQRIQSFAQTFCPNILASASAHPTSTATSAGSPGASLVSSSTSNLANIPSSAAPNSPTSSVIDLHQWGANFPGTNWQSVTTSSKSNRGPAVEGVSITLFIIACFIVGLRLYARMRLQQLRQVAQGLGWDELFACIALAFVGGVLGTVIVGVNHGMGKHQDYQTAAQLTTLIKSVYYFTILIGACFCALKISILCLYLRMTPEKSHRITIFVILGLVAAHSTATIISNIFQCHPISDYWDITKIFNNTMGCVNLIVLDIFNSAWSVMENIVIWFLPIPVVWKLKVPRARKVGLYTLIGVSFIAVIASCVRVGALILWILSSDISWNYPLLPLMCMIQSCVALVTSSLPAIYPLLRTPTPEQVSRRQSRMPDVEVENEKAWNSQGSTLNQSNADRRSRWSFLTWNGYHAAKLAHAQPEEVPEEEHKKGDVESSSISDVRPVTQHTMTAYVSSSDEVMSINEQINSHRRIFSADEESLTVPRIYMGGSRDRDSGTSRTSDEEYTGVGQAR